MNAINSKFLKKNKIKGIHAVIPSSKEFKRLQKEGSVFIVDEFDEVVLEYYDAMLALSKKNGVTVIGLSGIIPEENSCEMKLFKALNLQFYDSYLSMNNFQPAHASKSMLESMLLGKEYNHVYVVYTDKDFVEKLRRKGCDVLLD